ncbi:lig [Symbiodinium natans]|uniref:Lig protein n=1 Tax=Symbiodinium natans TaxID=878477 RepID=A0A812U0Q3_9DINO|nr:lig [Symbiodinium natans]
MPWAVVYYRPCISKWRHADFAQASLCCCWERQKPPEDLRPPRPPARAGPAHLEPLASAAADDIDDDEEIDVRLCARNTFLQYRPVANCEMRSRRVPKSMRPCRKTERVNGMAAGNMGENAGDHPPIDDAYEPF